MRILFFMNAYPDSRNGGIENVTRLLTGQFVQQGIEVGVVYLYESPYDHSDDASFYLSERLEPCQLGQRVAEVVRQYGVQLIVNRCVIFATPLIREAVRNTPCRIVTTYNNKPSADVPTLGMIFNQNKLSVLKKGSIALLYPLFAIRSKIRLRRRHRESYAASDVTVLLSQHYIPEYASMMGVGTEKLVCMNNPLKNGLALAKDEMRNKEKILLMVTRLDENQKCIIKALKVWQRLSVQAVEWRLKIVGSGPDERMIKRYAQKQHLERIDFIPACNPENHYRKATLFLMTSRNEGWPNTLNEAMRLGCVPVVLATFSAINDMIDPGENGILLLPGRESAELDKFVMALRALILDEQTRLEMAERAVLKTQRLAVSEIATQWIGLFERLTSGRNYSCE